MPLPPAPAPAASHENLPGRLSGAPCSRAALISGVTCSRVGQSLPLAGANDITLGKPASAVVPGVGFWEPVPAVQLFNTSTYLRGCRGEQRPAGASSPSLLARQRHTAGLPRQSLLALAPSLSRPQFGRPSCLFHCPPVLFLLPGATPSLAGKGGVYIESTCKHCYQIRGSKYEITDDNVCKHHTNVSCGE